MENWPFEKIDDDNCGVLSMGELFMAFGIYIYTISFYSISFYNYIYGIYIYMYTVMSNIS